MSKQIPFVVIILLILLNCNNPGKKNEQIIEEEPLIARLIKNPNSMAELDLPQEEFSINPSKEAKLLAASGTEIHIPPGAFIKKSGFEPKGKLVLKYKEIKTPSDIIIENVDMTYDSAGITYQFQTAGMFDLRVYSDNEELILKKGKTIQVSYISDKPGNFNLYHFDGKWNYKSAVKADLPLNAEANDNYRILTLKPVKADLSNDLIIDIKTDHAQFAELKSYKKLLWKYSGDLKKDQVAKILNSDIYNTELVSLDLPGKYVYKFKSQSGSFEFPVTPVLSPKAYQSAINDYNKMISKNQPAVKIKRTVNVTELGLMNYDRIYHRSDAVLVKAGFKINNSKVQGLPLFHITGEDDVIVRVDNLSEITYSPDLSNKIVAILPGKKVAVISTAGFFKSVNDAPKGQQVNFELKELETIIKSPADLNKIISSL